MSRSVVLTGATGGIGSAIARALVRRGDRLLLVARGLDALDRMTENLVVGTAPGTVAALAADVTRAEDRATIAALAQARGVDTLINAAAVPCFGALEDLEEHRIERVVATNLLAPILLTRVLLPVLRRRPAGTVLNIGSALGRIGLPGFSVYGATKFGLRGFTESLRREASDGGVRILHLAPRSTQTAFNDARVSAYNRATGTHSDTPETVSRAVVAMLDGGPAERFLGLPEALAGRLNALLPTWLDRAFRSHRAALDAQRSPIGAESTRTLEITE